VRWLNSPTPPVRLHESREWTRVACAREKECDRARATTAPRSRRHKSFTPPAQPLVCLHVHRKWCGLNARLRRARRRGLVATRASARSSIGSCTWRAANDVKRRRARRSGHWADSVPCGRTSAAYALARGCRGAARFVVDIEVISV